METSSNSGDPTRPGRGAGLIRLLALVAALVVIVVATPASGAQIDPTEDPTGIWTLEEGELTRRRARAANQPLQFQAVRVDQRRLSNALSDAPSEDEASPLVFRLPTPDGRFEAFEVEATAVLADSLAEAHPSVATYRGTGVDDPSASVYFTNTPLGLKAQVRSDRGNWFVSPATNDGGETQYRSYLESALPPDDGFVEDEIVELAVDAGFLAEAAPGEVPLPPEFEDATPTGTELRIHRIAFSTTGDYSAAFGDDDTAIVASVANLVTFLNGIYEPELTIRFVLEDTVIFKEPTPRPGTASCTGLGPAVDIALASGSGGGFAVRIDTVTPHNMSAGDLVEITGSDPAIDGSTSVIATFNANTLFINNGAVVNSTTGTIQTINVVTDPPYCDPFTDSPSVNLGPNQTVLDAEVGAANYDVGHVLGTRTFGGSGVASLDAVGVDGRKARGASHSSDVGSPVPFLLQRILRHEIGHQYGSSHTFSGIGGSCANQYGGAGWGVEPGSGSTIMAYGGICNADNIVVDRDPYFHAVSAERINDHLASVGLDGGTPTGNTLPVVTVDGPTYIPGRTPFVLSGDATDADGDSLTFVWEQFDAGTQTALSALVDDTSALFRSFPPSSTGNERTIPTMDKVLDNNTNANDGTCPGSPPGSSNPNSGYVQCMSEFLPTASGLTGDRVINFRLTARDNRAGGGGVVAADQAVTVVDETGPFLVTAPNTPVTWAGGTDHTVTWDVAGTTAAPISAANVDIDLSLDGGLTWQSLVVDTPNDGTESVLLPEVATTEARIRVKASDNIFFDVSDSNFTISATDYGALELVDPCVAFTGALAAGGSETFDGVNICGVPSTATAVVYTVSAIDPTGVGNLRLSPSGSTPLGGIVNYSGNGLHNSNTVTIPMDATGTVDVSANANASEARVVVIGYYDSTGSLRYNPLTPCAVADSRDGVGAFAGPFNPGDDYPDVDVMGLFSTNQGAGTNDCGVPREAEGIVVNVVAVGSTGGSGGLAVGPGGTEPVENTTNFGVVGLNNAAVDWVSLDGGETIATNITPLAVNPSVHIRLVVLGYLAPTGPDFTPVVPCAVFDSRDTITGDPHPPSGAFAGKRDGGTATTYKVAGAIPAAQGAETACGVPEGASGVLINLVAIQAESVGNLRAYATGTTPTGGVVNFNSVVPPINNSNAVVVPIDATGQLDLFVNAPNTENQPTVHVRGVVLGYYYEN